MGFLISMFLMLSLATHKSLSDKIRSDFPTDFIFGAGTSAYQVEGGAFEDGRKPSIWDAHTHAGKMPDKSTGDVAADEYHKYKEDVKLMQETGLDAYRFSISWSRLIPDGRGAVNPKGLEYYNNLINDLISHGIQPHVTLFHYDLPLALEEEYKGWLSPKIVDDFKAFAEVCFRGFGDRVKYWSTLNEPNVLIPTGYDYGTLPPQRCSQPFGFVNCTAGDSTTEPYIAGHNALLAHAAAASLYKEKFQSEQKGFIGLTIFCYWYTPVTNSTADIKARQRVLDFHIGWFLNPLFFGDYPDIMKKIAGSRLPTFTEEGSEIVKGSFDFIGVNHYASLFVLDDSNRTKTDQRDYQLDMFAKFMVSKDGEPTTQPAIAFPVVPWGIRRLLEYIKQTYKNPMVFIHENGYRIPCNNSTPLSEALNDTARVTYLENYIEGLLDAVRNGSNTKGYFVWSFIDLFEILEGYRFRYGLYHVDFGDKDLKRYPRLSANWYSNFIKKRTKGREIEPRLLDLFHSSV
ncbi:beta-glucosidase 22 isoform X2 [Amborella trichopoda]|uniref:beta-glucosidase 22 isoform X2 n=1 Tax=Amborella trichopoda TaxID=13333 RepID=UPI0005D38C69|nr:beta-glucosidase 22 isoform X2 [Amborella trichopoda]|eukprot:XP_006840571.2 beta-glucosidase 22 isoform X2 [Amborella trichopoda]